MNVLDATLVDITREIVLEDFHPRYGQLDERFPSNALWRRLRELGSLLWLDTGEIGAIEPLWTQEFAALTTNNSLLNKEVQRGTYDELVRRSARRLRETFPQITDAELVHEIAFILNAYHGLRLVERFDAYVSVEEHTDLAEDVEQAVGYGKRYHAICPERFIVKVPLSVDGLLAARSLGQEGVPVNFTLGFSARQNVLIAMLARPQFCNVFLGRLNQLVKENYLGDGRNVGERATAGSQRAIQRLRHELQLPTRQIAASLRAGEQAAELAGVDVLTMPPQAAQELLDLGLEPARLQRGIERDFEVHWSDRAYAANCAVTTLWDVPENLPDAVREALDEGLDQAQPWRLQRALAKRGFADLLPRWSAPDHDQARADGKIPRLENWRDRLCAGEIGLDALMTLHGLEAFAKDQQAMDDRIREHMD